MVEYRLTVVKVRIPGHIYDIYLHAEGDPIRIAGFGSLINNLLQKDPKVLAAEPEFRDIDADEQAAIRGVRQLILDKKDLESQVEDSGCDLPWG